VRVLLAAGIGLAIGVLTSIGQTVLDRPFAALANSASVWLMAPFLLGYVAATSREAMVLGALVCLGELLGYYATSGARGLLAEAAVPACASSVARGYQGSGSPGV
jgi:hypothetical protein